MPHDPGDEHQPQQTPTAAHPTLQGLERLTLPELQRWLTARVPRFQGVKISWSPHNYWCVSIEFLNSGRGDFVEASHGQGFHVIDAIAEAVGRLISAAP